MAPSPLTTAQLHAPRRSLASCVRAYVGRDTTQAPLAHEQRFNHFPATSLCSITWVMEGEICPVEDGAVGAALGSVIFSGPQPLPRSSYNPGPVSAFMVLLFPPAVHALTGLDLEQRTGQLLPAGQVLDEAWLRMGQAVLQAPSDEARIQLIEDFLEPQWVQAREQGHAPGHALGDWVQSLAMHAATSGWGRSVRNLERRVKAWVGQPLRSVRRLHRAEQSFVMNRDDVVAGQTNWAEFAQRGGYADQAHMCRETRQVTGHSPAELVRRAREDEGYWIYRVWS